MQFDRLTNCVYVGADIGAWESADSGATLGAAIQRAFPTPQCMICKSIRPRACSAPAYTGADCSN